VVFRMFEQGGTCLPTRSLRASAPLVASNVLGNPSILVTRTRR